VTVGNRFKAFICLKFNLINKGRKINCDKGEENTRLVGILSLKIKVGL
jgi:hypothetical protein